MGSTRVARRAGMTMASSATAASAAAIDDVGERVGRRHAPEERRADPREHQRGGGADDEAEGDQPHAVAQDHAEHGARGGAERHADADLLRALRDGVAT